MHLREDDDEFLDPATCCARSCSQYSDHIALPIVLLGEQGGDAQPRLRACGRGRRRRSPRTSTRNSTHHVAHSFDDPWLTLHWRAEGKIEYTRLLYIPSAAPFDLFHPDRKHGVKLYVKRVFITDRADELLPRLPALPARRGRFRGPAAQHQPRDAAAQPGAGPDPRRRRQARPVRPREEGEGRRRGLRDVLEQFRRGAQGRPVRGSRAPRHPARPRPVPLRPRSPTSGSASPTMSAA